MTAPIVEAFSVEAAAILDGTTGAEAVQLYGIRDGKLDIDTDSYRNTGNDTILSVWNWFNLATLEITSGFLPWDAISLMTGAPITSSGAAGQEYWNMALWNEGALNQPSRPVLIRTPSKDSQGRPRYLDFVLYKCTFQPMKLDGPAYKNGMTVSFTAQALMSSVDERGIALPERAIGRMVSRPIS
jgi:hypothetical protein